MKKIIILIFIGLTVVFGGMISYDAIAFAINSNNQVTAPSATNQFLLDSSLFTQPENNEVYVQENTDLTGFNLKISNELLEVYSNNQTGAIRIRNIETNYIWATDLINIEDFSFNNKVKSRIQSSFALTYRDENDKPKEVLASDREVTLVERVINNTLYFDVKITSLAISFTYQLTLKSNKLVLLLENSSIREEEDKITSLTFFSYLGSVYKDTIPGYIFIPSGNGALIRYSESSPITSSYYTSFYGSDANRIINSESEILSLPIYGMVHGVKQNALFVDIKSGAAFANLNYSPPSIDKNFSLVYPTFNLRETYSMLIPGSSSILMVPDDFYKENIEIEYTFLDNDDADYIGFAKTYQQELESRSIISRLNNNDSTISMQIEAFGMDYEKGLILKKYYEMTTTKDIINLNSDLKKNNIDNIFYTLRAFNNGGYSNQKVNNFDFESRLGRLSDLEDLETYFYYNPIESYNSSKSYPRNILVNTSNEKNYIKIDTEKYKFYADVNSVVENTKKAVNEYNNIVFDGLGYRLYGDTNNELTRNDTLKLYSDLFASDYKTAMYTPNYYLLKNTSKYLNMPLYHDRLRFISDSVPFLQILLKGYIDYYSTFLNFSSNVQLDLLKCVEYGTYPAYLVSNKEGYLLANTLSSNYYATYYGSSSEMIKEQYRYLNEALSKVCNAKIENREIISKGISVVIYDNGIKIIVNYTNTPYSYSGQIVASMDYLVI